jgi:proteic killer suppression protein
MIGTINLVMIKSFNCKETQKVFERSFSKKLPHHIQTKARQKLLLINAATDLNDLRVPPGNKLEELKDDRKGQHRSE